MLTEWTTSNGFVLDQTSVSEGIGGKIKQNVITGSAFTTTAYPHSSRSLMHGFYTINTTSFYVPTAIGTTAIRRYQFQLNLGLLQQSKLLPTKWMASQLAIELTLAREEDCIIIASGYGATGASTTVTMGPKYQIQNFNMIPEILEFDASYDNMFLKGLQEGGVPIKFSSWHTYQFSHPGGLTANILIQERSRSVKSIFTVIRRQASTLANDSGALLANLASTNQLQSYQYRIGGRYFPASPVQVNAGDQYDNGSCEAFVELQKALHTIGDGRLCTNVSALNWAPKYLVPSGIPASNGATSLAESDYTYGAASDGSFAVRNTAADNNQGGVPALGLPSGCFCFSTNLETSSGMEISGLNAEEQSDISLNMRWTGTAPAAGDFVIETYVFYDAMIVLRENNVFNLFTVGPRIDPVIKCVFSFNKWIILNLKLIPHMQLFPQ
jgi:hypothetical protein